MFACYQEHCENLQRTGNYRQLPVESLNSSIQLDFSSNDYLNLSRHPQVLQAGIEAARTYGQGSTGSRLLSGHHPIFTDFERQIAKDKKTERALLFSSGFQANLAVLSSLLNPKVLKQKPLVFFDKLNHASLYQAVFLSQATLIRYRHLDYDDLSSCLNAYAGYDGPKFIVTETLFGMDGDVVPLDRIMMLAREHGAFVYLDEAHAVGLLGEKGYGLSTSIAHDVPCLVMGTLSKAIGSSGAYVAGSASLIDYVMNTATGFIFSTAPSPFVIGAAFEAWTLIPSFSEIRKTWFELAEHFRLLLQRRGFNVGTSTTPIIPLIMGSVEKACDLQLHLQALGIRTSLIRRPTVPPKGERIRIALNVAHTMTDIQFFLSALT